MSSNNEPTIVEKGLGHPISTAAIASVPLLVSSTILLSPELSAAISLIPALAGILPFGRYQERIKKSLQDISNDLEVQKEKLDNLTDAQFKLINEITSTVLSTINEEKLTYLRNAINNTLDDDKILDHESVLISRIIRDISVDEIKFLLDPTFNGQKYNKISFLSEISPESTKVSEGRLYIKMGSSNELIILGLISLGLLHTYSEIGGESYSYNPLAEKLRNLLREKPDK